MKSLINRVETKYKLTEVVAQRDNLVFAYVDKEFAIDMVTYMRDYEGYTHFTLMSCVDWIEEGNFQLLYLLNNPTTKTEFGIKVAIDRDEAVMQSAHHLWKQIWTYQRELKEAFGIDFPGSPRVDEDFVVEGWDDMPHMRRDFDTNEYAEKTYFMREGRKTYDPATYMRQKLYPNQPVTAKKNKDEQ